MRLKSRMRTATDTTLRHLAMLTAIPVGLRGKSTSLVFEGLRWWLAGFGSLVEVLGLESLREDFRDEVRRLARIYGAMSGDSAKDLIRHHRSYIPP